MAEDTPPDTGDDSTTMSTKARWEYIGTVLAGLMVSSLPVIIVGAALGTLTLSPIGQAWFVLYGTVTLMAATWAFGEETLNAVNKARGK